MDMTDPKVREMVKHAKRVMTNGMSPRQVADITFEAIREKKFYILPNMETGMSAIQTRMEDILHQRNPTTVTFDFFK